MKTRYIFNIAAGIALAAFLFIGCKKGKPPPDDSRIPDIKVEINYTAIDLDGFDELSMQDKILAYHLTTAAASGDPIVYAQLHPEALKIKGFLDGIFSHSMGIKPYLIEAMRDYGQLFYANHGFRNLNTREKIVPAVDIHQFNEAVLVAASNGARVGYVSHKDIWDTFLELDNVIYDAAEKPEKWRRAEGEIIRVGNDTLPEGLFSEELSGVADNLRKAKEYAGADFGKQLEQLAISQETGLPKDYNEYLNSWFENDPEIDIAVGFTQHSGLYYGLVYLKDENRQKQVTEILRITDDIINSWSLNEIFGIDMGASKVVTADLLSAYGIYGYSPSPTLSRRGNSGIKIVYFSNVGEALSGTFSSIQKAMCVSQEDYVTAVTFLDQYDIVQAIAAEMVESLACGSKAGHGSQKGCSPVNSVFKEALVLRILIDNGFANAGIYPEKDFIKIVGEIWIRESLARLSMPGNKCSAKSRKYLVDYLLSQKAVAMEKIAGKTYLNIEDSETLRSSLSVLIDVLRQKGSDLPELDNENGLSDEVIEEISNRLKSAGLSSATYMLTPKVNLKTTRMGKVKDVLLSIPEDIIDSAVDTAIKNSK